MNQLPVRTRTKSAPRQLMLSFGLLLLLIGTEFHPAAAATPRPSPPTQNGDLVVEIMQTGRDSTDFEVNDELVFRVRAFDSSVGNRDGDGIRNVDMIILDENGREVYRRHENNAGYCAFGGGEPTCNVFDFAANDDQWPNGKPIRDGGEYTLRAVVNAKDSRRVRMGTPIQINLRDSSGSSDLVVELMQTGRGNSADVVEDELVFRVRAFDPRRGSRDGDGIRSVDMIILDSDEREVYRKRENNAGYCAFGGGEPTCAVFDLADNDYTLPNGEEIRRGEEYILRAQVNAKDGRSTIRDFRVEIR